MKKILGLSFVVLLLLVVGVFITLQYFLGGIVKAGVNKYGPAITQTKVQLASARISPLSGDGTLSGLAVANPAGWTATDAFRLGEVHINLEPFSVFKDYIVINELTIDRPEFFYETKLIASNVGDLLKNIEQSVGSGKDGAPTSKNGKPIKLVVKKLVLREARVTLGVGGQAITMPMPELNMTDIGVAEGGITPAQLAFAIMRNVTTNVVAASTQALGKVGGTSGAAAIESAKQIGEGIKGLFGGSKK